MLGAGFGLPAEAALALSLLKRARDFTIGLPALGAYQLVESRALLHAIASRFSRSLKAKPRPRRPGFQLTRPGGKGRPCASQRVNHQGDSNDVDE